MGATVVLMRRLNQDLRPVLVLVALNLVFTVLAPRIAWEAHVGGLVAGAIIGYAMVHAPRGRRALVQWDLRCGPGGRPGHDRRPDDGADLTVYRV